MKEKQVDIDFEMGFYEGILRRNPCFVEALSALGDIYTNKGWYEKGLKIDETLYHLRPFDPIILYNLTCSYSLLGEVDKALRSIKRAVKYGYGDFHYMKKDDDLLNLRQDKRFRRYLARVMKKELSREKV